MIVSEDATDHGGCCGLIWEATSAVGVSGGRGRCRPVPQRRHEAGRQSGGSSRSPDDRKSRRLSCRPVPHLTIVPGLPVDDDASGEVDPVWRLAAAFVLSYRSDHTRRTYARDIRAFYSWCAQVGLYPLKVHRAHLDAYLRQLEQTPQPTTGRPAAPASVARRLSVLSGLYRYAVKEGVLDCSPMTNIGRRRHRAQIGDGRARRLMAYGG